MKLTRLALVAAVLPALALTSAPDDAHACGMAIRADEFKEIARPTPAQEISRAEKALEGGQNQVAIRAVLGSFPGVRNVVAGQNPLQTRALRVLALAIVRSEGKVSEKDVGIRPAAGVEWTPQANFEWAAAALREIDVLRPNDPAVQADLGEALTRLPHRQDDAMKLLQGLAQKDLMGSPHAYAALAKLRTSRGDEAGADAAIKRCEEMTRSPGICKPSKTAPAAKA